MALITCPECGREISDKADKCLNCGCPSSEWVAKEPCNDDKKEDETKIILEICQKYSKNEKIKAIKEMRERLGFDLKTASQIADEYFIGNRRENFSYLSNNDSAQNLSNNCEKKFNGIYRCGIFGGKTEVYCPRCGSENCSYYQEQKIIPGKTKTRYTANLNPLHPFTFVNKKEKVIKKEQLATETKIICNDCGRTFK